MGKDSSDMQSTADYGGTGSPGAARQDCPKFIRCGSNTQKNAPWSVEAGAPLAPSSKQVAYIGIVAAAPRHLRRFFFLRIQLCRAWLLFFYIPI